jgi:uncharacterized sodium:solute symporter family permease YidK
MALYFLAVALQQPAALALLQLLSYQMSQQALEQIQVPYKSLVAWVLAAI